MNRRNFIAGTGALCLASSFSSSRLYASSEKKNLVIIMLRGGLDGLAAVPMIGNGELKKIRKSDWPTDTKKLSSDFALHGELSSYYDLWKAGQASVVHATSIPYTGRSHFEGQNVMEIGGTYAFEDKFGWLGRGMEVASADSLALSLAIPSLLRNKSNTDNFYPSKWGLPSDGMLAALQSSYAGEPLLENAMTRIRERTEASRFIKAASLDILAGQAAEGLSDPFGPNVAVFEIDEFDTHSQQTHNLNRQLAVVDELFSRLSKGMGPAFENTLVLTLTEFGRRVDYNGGGGTDHGYGTSVLMAGGLLKEAQVYADWPGLKTKDLYEGRDLMATTDARSIYCSAMATCFEHDFDHLRKEAFFGANLENLSDRLFKT